jgi:outer membrane protein assembly factor BamB
MTVFRSAIALLFLGFVSLVCLGDEPGTIVLSGSSRATAARLEEARARIAEGNVADALTLLRTVIDTGNNDLVKVKDGRSVAARWLSHTLLARLKATDLVAYRKRVDGQARNWLEQAERTGEPGPLLQIVEETFCSRQTPAALDALGDRAFARGRFEEAEAYWRLLAPIEPIPANEAESATLAYPDPPTELVPRIHAKQILACIFADRSDWQAKLDVFRHRHPKASGVLCGRKGLYADILAATAKERGLAIELEPNWPTFGGSPSRGRIASAPPRLLDRLARLCRGGATWTFDLEQRSKVEPFSTRIDRGQELALAQRLAFFPVLWGHHALVADARYVTAYDLRTGKSEDWFDATKVVGGINPHMKLPAVANLRYSLTVAEGSVFARLGTQTVRDVRPSAVKNRKPGALLDDKGESVLVSLALRPGPDGNRLRWLVRAIDPARKEYAVFEGAPLVHEGRVYIAASRFEGDRLVTAIHCYPAHAEDSPPPLLWRTDVCETRELLPGADSDRARTQRSRHHLLTLAGARVVYCSHSGAVVAVDARNGRRCWGLLHGRRDLREPEDQPTLRELSPPVFADGRLYVAPADSDHLYCLDPQTGASIWERERLDVVHLVGVGQGRLIFTTWRNPRLGQLHAGGLRAVMANDGSDSRGWVLPDDGGGLVPFGKPLLVGDLVLWPTVRPPYGVFAVRQIDGQQPDNPALLHGVPSGNLLFANGCLMVTDQHSMRAFVPPEWLDESTTEKLTNRPPRRSLLRAQAAVNRGEIEKALAHLSRGQEETISRSAELRSQRHAILLAAMERSITTKSRSNTTLLSRAVEAATPRERLDLLACAARSYEAVRDRDRARAAWKEILTDEKLNDQTLIEHGLPQRATWIAQRSIPGASSLLEQAQLETKAGRNAPAALAWLRYLSAGASGEEEASAVEELSRVWDKLDCPEAVRHLRTRPGREILPGSTTDWTASIDVKLDPGERFLPTPGAEGPLLDQIWSARTGELVCRSRRTGELLRRIALRFAPTWARSFGTLVLAAGEQGIAAVDAPSGAIVWAFAPPGRGLGNFHLTGLYLIFTQGNRHLFGMDVVRGAVRWQRHAPGALCEMPAPRGRFHAVQPVASNRLLAQASTRRMLIDSHRGTILTSVSAPLGPWVRAPLVLATGHICQIPDPERVQLVDPEQGKVLWTYTLPGETTRSGEPPVVIEAQDAVMVVEPWNIGYRLQKLDRATGKPLWSRSPLFPLDRLDESGWLTSSDTLYYASGGQLSAWAIADGKRLWQRPLPGEGGWRLTWSGKSLLAWMDRSTAIRFRYRSLVGSLQWRVGPLPGASAWSVSCLDGSTGAPIRRVTLEPEWLPRERDEKPAGSGRGVRPSVFPLFGVDRDETGSPGPVVVHDRRGLVVAIGNRVKILANGSSSSK